MSHHTDLLGYDLQVGDHVVYATGRSSSKHMCVAEIIEIIDYDAAIYRYNRETRKSYTQTVPRWKARLQPKVYNDYRTTDRWGYKDGAYQKLEKDLPPKQVMIEKVANLVKVTLPDG